MTGATHLEPEYVAARRVLLDALMALGRHRRAVVLVGAQAIYLRVGPGELAVAPYTTDGDLAVDPSHLSDEPLLTEALERAGFKLEITPGTWSRQDVQIDLLVPTSLSGPGRRGARLGVHGTEVARKAKGLEAAVVDSTDETLVALEAGDPRSVTVAVAGLAGLLVAKLHKLDERASSVDRLSAKDGLDILRILQSAELELLGARLADLERDAVAGAATTAACAYLQQHFATRGGHGAAMAVLATAGLEDAETITGSCVALATELLRIWAALRNT